MRRDTDRAFDEAYERGRKNAEIIELARRHRVNMQFLESGGRGLAEEASGLPINMRRVHCPFGKPDNSMSMNLEWIAVDFYEENCEGCPHRRPTGGLPNLATLVEERREAAKRAEAEASTSIAAEHSAWQLRHEYRQAMRSNTTAAMSSAVADLAVIDHDPAARPGEEAIVAARRRLEALADRGPELFTEQVVGHISELVRSRGLLPLLGVLRRLALKVSLTAEPSSSSLSMCLRNERVWTPPRALLIFMLK